MNNQSGRILKFSAYILLCGVVGFFGGSYAGKLVPKVEDISVILLIISCVLGVVIQIIVHEAGHLVFGLLTGYKFVSFRVFDFKLEKDDNNKFKLRLQHMRGTLGQCLMKPPKYIEGKFRYKLYLAGGVLGNLIFSVAIWFIYPSIYTLMIVMIGIIFGISNAIPSGFNDGMTYKLSTQDETNKYVLYLTLVVNYYASIGKSYIEEHPEELEKIKNLKIEKPNYNTDALKLIEYDYYQEQFEFEKAYHGLLEFYKENPDMVLPYKMEVSKLLIFFMCLLDKENPLLEELLADPYTKSTLKANVPQNKTINALIEWKVNNNPEKALELLEEGRKILDKSPNLRAQIMEEKYISYIKDLIMKEK